MKDSKKVPYAKNFNKMLQKYGINANVNAEFETERLVLKPFLSTKMDEQYTTYFLKNKAEYENFYSKSYDKDEIIRLCHPFDFRISVAVYLKATKRCVGYVLIRTLEGDDAYNIGYYIKPKHRMNGYAFEAVSAQIKRAFTGKIFMVNENADGVACIVPRKFNSLCISVREDNFCSIGLAKKLGFKNAGVEENFYNYHGKNLNSLKYILFKKDYIKK